MRIQNGHLVLQVETFQRRVLLLSHDIYLLLKVLLTEYNNAYSHPTADVSQQDPSPIPSSIHGGNTVQRFHEVEVKDNLFEFPDQMTRLLCLQPGLFPA